MSQMSKCASELYDVGGRFFGVNRWRPLFRRINPVELMVLVIRNVIANLHYLEDSITESPALEVVRFA